MSAVQQFHADGSGIFAESNTGEIEILDEVAHPERHTGFRFYLENKTGKVTAQPGLGIDSPPTPVLNFCEVISSDGLVGDLSVEGDSCIILLASHIRFAEVLECDLGPGTNFVLESDEIQVVHLLPFICEDQSLPGGKREFPMVILPRDGGAAFDNDAAKFPFNLKENRCPPFLSISTDAEFETVEGFPLLRVVKTEIR